MELTICRKLKLLPSPKDQTAFLTTLSAIKASLNYVSAEIHQSNDLDFFSLNLCLYRSLRSLFGLKAQMAQSVLKTVIARYKSLNTNGHEWTKIIFKKPDCALVYGRDYSFTGGKLSINTLNGRIRTGYSVDTGELPSGVKFGTATLLTRKGKFFLHIPITMSIAEPEDISSSFGVDMGINFLATSYDGRKTSFFDGRSVKVKRAKYQRVRKELQKVGTPAARRRLKAIGQRERRFMTDVNHQLSKALVEQAGENSLIVIEDLTGIRRSTERVRVKDRYVSVSWAFYQLRQMIEYKAVRNGSVVAAADPRYTSQTCPCCNHIAKANRSRKTHIFKCQLCGYQSNDDRVAAMNLRLKGIKYLTGGLG